MESMEILSGLIRTESNLSIPVMGKTIVYLPSYAGTMNISIYIMIIILIISPQLRWVTQPITERQRIDHGWNKIR